MPKNKNQKNEKYLLKKEHVFATIAVFLVILFIIGGVYRHLHQNRHAKPTIYFSKKTLIPTPTPTPTPDMSLQNTFRTYTNMLYGFSINYPALGENNSGALISCGNHITQAITINDLAIRPVIYLDSFYKITIIPWGAELGDFISQHNPKPGQYASIIRNSYPGADESALFYNTKPNIGYFANTFALLKKGNLIFQLDVNKSQRLGCQMLFDPREYNTDSLLTNPKLANILLSQYQSWNEATSIHFGK